MKDKTNKKKKGMTLAMRQNLVGYSFILPNFIGFFIFIFIPVIFSLVLSFSHWDGFTEMEFAGFENFVDIFKRQRICGFDLADSVLLDLYSAVLHACVSGTGAASESEDQSERIFPLRTVFPLCGISGCDLSRMERYAAAGLRSGQ